MVSGGWWAVVGARHTGAHCGGGREDPSSVAVVDPVYRRSTSMSYVVLWRDQVVQAWWANEWQPGVKRLTMEHCLGFQVHVEASIQGPERNITAATSRSSI